jgi:hypothetical protein
MARIAIFLPDPGANDSAQAVLVPDAVLRGKMLFTGGGAGYDAKGSLPEANGSVSSVLPTLSPSGGRAAKASAFSHRGDDGRTICSAGPRHSSVA